MIQGVNNIDWTSLKTAYGNGEALPGILESLLSYDYDIFNNALEQLYSYIYHQGTIYDATPKTIPFLIEILSMPNFSHKEEILQLLVYLNGSSQEWINSDPILRDVVSSSRLGISVFFELLMSDNSLYKEGAAAILSTMYQDKYTVIPKIFEQAQYEKDLELKAFLLYCAGSLLQTVPSKRFLFCRKYLRYYLDLVYNNQNRLLEYTSSICVLYVLKSGTPSWIINKIIQAVINVNINPYMGKSYRMHAVSIKDLLFLGKRKGAKALIQIIDMTEDDWQVQNILEKILDLLFGSKIFNDYIRIQGPNKSVTYYIKSKKTLKKGGIVLSDFEHKNIKRSSKDLTKTQFVILRKLVKMSKIWNVKSNLLELYGLPTSQEELQKFLVES